MIDPDDSHFGRDPDNSTSIASTESLSPAASQSAASFHPLAPQYIVFEQRTNYVASAIFGTVVVAATTPVFVVSLLRNRWWLAALLLIGWAVLAGVLIFGSHFWPRIKYRHIHWRLGETGMEIARGVLWRHRVAIPVARVQHVDVSQGPVQRMFRLATLTIHTAGTKNSSVDLDGLEHDLALKLRDQLISQKESLDVT